MIQFYRGKRIVGVELANKVHGLKAGGRI